PRYDSLTAWRFVAPYRSERPRPPPGLPGPVGEPDARPAMPGPHDRPAAAEDPSGNRLRSMECPPRGRDAGNRDPRVRRVRGSLEPGPSDDLPSRLLDDVRPRRSGPVVRLCDGNRRAHRCDFLCDLL